jgi:hypothetical protein
MTQRMTRMDGFSAAKKALEEIEAEDSDDSAENYKVSPTTKHRGFGQDSRGSVVRRTRTSGERGSGERGGERGSGGRESQRGTMAGGVKSKGYRNTFTNERSKSQAGGAVMNAAAHSAVLFAPADLNDQNRYQGNVKLRRMIAEELLGWEFKEDEEEDLLAAQHEAMARRRSSAFRAGQ